MTRQEAQELLPWFVAGTLSDDENRAVQAFIDNGEIAQAELDELALYAEAVNEQTVAEPAYNPQILQRAMSALDTVPQTPLAASDADTQTSSRPARSGPGLWERLTDALGWQATPTFARVAMGAQFAALLALAVVVAAPDGEFETVSGPASGAAAAFTIGFAEDATLRDVQQLLLDNNVRIVAGPNSIGMYDIAVTNDASETQVRDTLAASPLTTFLQPVAKQ